MDESVKLCDVIEGVQFTVLEQGVAIRALILRDALEEFFGADASPQSWLSAYREHKRTINRAACERYRNDPAATVTVLRAERPEDFTLASNASMVKDLLPAQPSHSVNRP